MRTAILIATLLSTSNALAAQTHKAVLTWTASPTVGVTGYNVYKIAGACPAAVTVAMFGAKLSSTTAAVKTYTDSTVTAGSTYCYGITATTAGGESDLNGTLQVMIPTFTPSKVPVQPGPTNVSAQ